MGASWILDDNPMDLVFNIKALTPRLIDDDVILKMPGNYMMHPTRRGALDDLFKEMEELTVMGAIEELNALTPLKWVDRTSLWQYFMSRFAIITGPLFFMVAIPFIKFRVRQFKRYAEKEHPEWWI